MFYIAFEAVLPLCILMAIGYFIRRVGICDQAFFRQLSALCFKVLFPMLVFNSIVMSDINEIFSPELSIFTAVCILVEVVLSISFAKKVETDDRRRGVLAQALFRSNFVLFGLPISYSLFGDEGLAVTAVLIAVIIPLYNILAVLTLEYFSDRKANYKACIKAIVSNPIIIASIVSFIFIGFDLELTPILSEVVSDVASASTTITLISLGGIFEFSKLRPNAKALTIAVIGRLLVVPLIFITVSIFFGFRNAELLTLMVVFASPTATTTYMLAQNSGADSTLASQIIGITSAFSVFSIFLWISTLKMFEFM